MVNTASKHSRKHEARPPRLENEFRLGSTVFKTTDHITKVKSGLAVSLTPRFDAEPRFESASALLSLQKLWFVDSVL